MKSKRDIFVSIALAVALIGGGYALGRDAQRPDAHATDTAIGSRSQNGALPSFADLAAHVAPAVVNIKVTYVAKTDFSDQLFGEDLPFPGFVRRLPGSPNSSNVRGPDQDSSSAKTA
jgi:S1-C subfamily serine protease